MATDIPGITNPKAVDTANEFAINTGENLPNHSTSRAGRGMFVRQGVPEVPTFRTKQQAFRFCAHVVLLAENNLPDEEGCELHTFPAVLDAVQNSR